MIKKYFLPASRFFILVVAFAACSHKPTYLESFVDQNQARFDSFWKALRQAAQNNNALPPIQDLPKDLTAKSYLLLGSANQVTKFEAPYTIDRTKDLDTHNPLGLARGDANLSIFSEFFFHKTRLGTALAEMTYESAENSGQMISDFENLLKTDIFLFVDQGDYKAATVDSNARTFVPGSYKTTLRAYSAKNGDYLGGFSVVLSNPENITYNVMYNGNANMAEQLHQDLVDQFYKTLASRFQN